jgi:hypothetical protein
MAGDDEWLAHWKVETEAFIAAETARMLQEVDAAAQAAVLEPWPDAPEADGPETAPHEVVRRQDYVPKDREADYLTRQADGSLTLRLVDAGDRLVVWSPLHGGGLINPKGPGLRTVGLVATYARGSSHYAAAFRAADLSKGRHVEVRREPANPYDRNAVALYAPGATRLFGYVQRGRAPAIARRMDSGEAMEGVCLRGPGKGDDEASALLLLGSEADLRQLLS